VRGLLGSGQVAFALGASVLALFIGGCGDDGDSQSHASEKQANLEALQDLPPFVRADFKAGDTNHDADLDDAELDAMVKEDFKNADVNGDGEIDAADLHRAFGNGVDSDVSLQGMDENGDGRVPLKEYSLSVSHDFLHHMDTNGDGHLDPPEVGAFYEAAGYPSTASISGGSGK
jgi:Ca2+-binding EF-hand superfamily protein